MGIDHSAKAWGIAISNPDLSMATPLTSLKEGAFQGNVRKLIELCKEYSVGGLVIGLPLNVDDSEGPRAQSVRHFAENLLKERENFGFDPPVAFWDERLSTSAAEDLLDEYQSLPRKRRDEIIDALAAQIILSDALKKIDSL